jgi:hypothetical protein
MGWVHKGTVEEPQGRFAIPKKAEPLTFDAFFAKAKEALQVALKIPEEYVYPKDLQAALLGFAATRYQAAQAGQEFVSSQELYQGAKTNFIRDVDHYQKLVAKHYENQPKSSDIVDALEAQMRQFLRPAKTNGHAL